MAASGPRVATSPATPYPGRNATHRVFFADIRMPAEGDAGQIEGRSALRRAVRNFGKLLRGRGVAAVLELVTVGLLARALSPGSFGNIVLIQTYVLVVRGLFNFKLYEVLVRFGVPLLEDADHSAFRQLLRITLLLDLISSVVATLTAVLAAPLVGEILGWETGVAPVSMWYSCVLLTYGFGTAKGILRIFDRYDVLGIQLMVGPLLRLAGVLVIMLVDPTLRSFVIALVLATAIGNGYLIVQGLAELRRQLGTLELKLAFRRSWRGDFPELAKFVGIVYWQGNIDMLPRHVSTLLAGTILGSAGAGLLRLARETTKVLSKPGGLLRQVLYPDLVRMWLRGTDTFRMVLGRAILISALVGFGFVVAAMAGGSALLTVALGADYAAAAPLMTLLLLATTVELMATVLRAAGYAMGGAGAILRLHLFSSVFYLLLFVLLTPWLGLIGPGFAACAAALVPLGGTGLFVVRGIRERHAPES
ncbi:MAG: lipopolysaccharide biosynthesis protein [Gammaproteobacteria bacterium]